MIVWLRRMFRSDESGSGQTEQGQEAIDTARRVQGEIDERIAFRDKEVAVIRTEQTRVRQELILNAPLIRKNEDLPGTMGRKS